MFNPKNNIKDSEVFGPLKEAIENVLTPYRAGGSCDSVVSVPERELKNLELIYNEFFVEPEDDEEWVKFQSGS